MTTVPEVTGVAPLAIAVDARSAIRIERGYFACPSCYRGAAPVARINNDTVALGLSLPIRFGSLLLSLSILVGLLSLTIPFRLIAVGALLLLLRIRLALALLSISVRLTLFHFGLPPL